LKTSDIPEIPILEYLYERQGEWTCLWYGNFGEGYVGPTGELQSDVYFAMPKGTPRKLALARMRNLHRRGLVGGCPCGCRGDFEITDKGLALLGKPRLKGYTGY